MPYTTVYYLIVSFTFAIRRDLIRLASAPFTYVCFRLAEFGCVTFGDVCEA